jgi:hypothetical protein
MWLGAVEDRLPLRTHHMDEKLPPKKACSALKTLLPRYGAAPRDGTQQRLLPACIATIACSSSPNHHVLHIGGNMSIALCAASREPAVFLLFGVA